ncbi:TIGR04282 family arsenosugar biosynthesis glycosyltransferase [bacterium]|nr:TIGR04282 family arsenosugar biosynthesis glycosyltransferase [bacterium]
MRILMVLAKDPSQGRAKTRLAATLGNERARELASAFLDDTLEHASAAASAVGARLLLLHDPPGEAGRAAFLDRARKLGIELSLSPQLESPSLGARLERAFADALSRSDAAVAIGTDSPDVSREDHASAFLALETAPAVLGPASDGGYWAVGLARGTGAERAFLDEIAWSTSRALSDTRAAFGKLGIRPALLAERADVDDAGSLAALEKRLREDPSRAPTTARALGVSGRLS